MLIVIDTISVIIKLVGSQLEGKLLETSFTANYGKLAIVLDECIAMDGQLECTDIDLINKLSKLKN